MSRRRWAFTLVDLLVTLTVLSVIAVVVVPLLADDTQSRLDAAARIMRSDLELAQVMTISDPARPVKVGFETPGCRTPSTPPTYELLYADGAPIQSPCYAVYFGEGRAAAARGVTLSLVNVAGGQITFNGLGGLEGSAPAPAFRLELHGRFIVLSISPATGIVTETAGP